MYVWVNRVIAMGTNEFLALLVLIVCLPIISLVVFTYSLLLGCMIELVGHTCVVICMCLLSN